MNFAVSGTPAPKGSRTLGRRRDGSTFTRPASNAEHRWTEAVALAALVARSAEPALPGPPYAVELTFHCPRPRRPEHGHPSRHDLDKLVRAVLDGLVRGGALEDDRHVTVLEAAKRWAPPGGEGVDISIATADREADPCH